METFAVILACSIIIGGLMFWAFWPEISCMLAQWRKG